MIVTGVSMIKDEEAGIAKTLIDVEGDLDHIFVLVDSATQDLSTDIIKTMGVTYAIADWVDFGTNRSLSISMACLESI